MAQSLVSRAKEALKLANGILEKSKKAANYSTIASLASAAKAASVSADAALLKVNEVFNSYKADEAVIETAIEALKTVEAAVNSLDYKKSLDAAKNEAEANLKTAQTIA